MGILTFFTTTQINGPPPFLAFAHLDMKLTNMVLVGKSATDGAVVADAKTIAEAVFREEAKLNGKQFNLKLINFGGAVIKRIGADGHTECPVKRPFGLFLITTLLAWV